MTWLSGKEWALAAKRADRRARKTDAPSDRKAAVFAAVFAAVQNRTYKFDELAHGCPALDFNLGAKVHWKARLPFLVTPVADGGDLESAAGSDVDAEETIAVGDEYMQCNSVCHTDPAQDFEGGEDDVLHCFSLQRVPDTQYDAKLFPGVRRTATERIMVEAQMPPELPEPVVAPTEDLSRALAEQMRPRDLWPRRVHYCLRQRQLRSQEAVRVASITRAHVSAVVAAPSPAADSSPQGEQDGDAMGHLAPDKRRELEDLLAAYPEQVSHSSDDMGAVPEKFKDFFLQIPTEPGARCQQRPYRLSHKELEEFKRQMANLLARGVVKKADGPTDFLSPVLFVPKPRDPTALRMCVDFRRLNAVTSRDHHALPDVRNLLQQMGGCRYFTALDLSSGFWALPIAEQHQHKTAFTGPDGEVYVWTKAAMGLSNSPAAFQRFMSHVLRGLPGVKVYIDDITLYSRTWREHVHTLRQVMDRLKDARLKIKYAKCVWAASECRVLGSIVNQHGIAPDPEKTAAIRQLPTPRNVADVRSFLGATGYFHEHVEQYAKRSDALRRLLKKNVPFCWTPECQAAFEDLRQALTSDAVLRMPDFAEEFILTTDWSKTAIGAVLSQTQHETPGDPSSPRKEYVIAYASRALVPAESHYAPTEGECLAAVWATRKFRQYLHGTPFTLRTDHAALQWLSTARFENSKLERWAMRLQEFQYKVEYLPGKDNVLADHLSRHKDEQFSHLATVGACAVAGHLAYATAGKALDVLAASGELLDPEAWQNPELIKAWHSGHADPESIAAEPCTVCGGAEGHAHMVICDICSRPYHVQCCQPPRSVVPEGAFQCHLCDQSFMVDAAELKRSDPLLFARAGDAFHEDLGPELGEYIRRQHIGARQATQEAAARGVALPPAEAVAAGAELAEQVIAHLPRTRRRRIRRRARDMRPHPTQHEWFSVRHTARSGAEVWAAVPPVEYRWGLIAAYHDRLGHAGINQTLRAMSEQYSWVGIKADVIAYVSQCHACQQRRLQAEAPAEPTRPEMSQPFQHVHVDLAGPFALRGVKSAGKTRTTGVSTEVVGKAYVLLVVDYFTKCAEFAYLPDKSAETVARAFHDHWLARYGVPEWVTSDNGSEFAGAFNHQLERFGIDHVCISAYHPQSNGAVERLVRTLKTILAAKTMNAVHQWPALLPTIRGEYMARVHRTLGCAPNEMVYGTPIKFPAPIGRVRTDDATLATQRAAEGLATAASTASVAQAYKHERDARMRRYCADAYDRILQAQTRNMTQRQRSSPKKGGRRQLREGDLAYLLLPGSSREVRGPYVVIELHDTGHVSLRTTAMVRGQAVNTYKVPLDQVARCTTVVDVLADLLKADGKDVKPVIACADAMMQWHTA